jgi:hypothetical protein
MEICFTIDGQRICIHIPLLVRGWIPPWVPIAEPTQPSPWRWLVGPNISEATQREILTVGLMTELAKSLSPEKAKPIQAALQTVIRDADLPKGVTVSF